MKEKIGKEKAERLLRAGARELEIIVKEKREQVGFPRRDPRQLRPKMLFSFLLILN